MPRAHLGLGANLGDRAASLNAAVDALDWGDTRVVARSHIYETDPFGVSADQPPYLNQAVEIDTSLDPRGLLDRCLAIEVALGRARAGAEPWGPRPIDVDVLLFGDVVVDEPDLKIPHPRLLERAFVLVPLAEIASETPIPGDGTVGEALRRLPSTDGVRRFEGLPR